MSVPSAESSALAKKGLQRPKLLDHRRMQTHTFSLIPGKRSSNCCSRFCALRGAVLRSGAWYCRVRLPSGLLQMSESGLRRPRLDPQRGDDR